MNAVVKPEGQWVCEGSSSTYFLKNGTNQNGSTLLAPLSLLIASVEGAKVQT